MAKAELSTTLSTALKIYRESKLDRLGRLLPFALGVLDKRCDDIASSVWCTASAYLHVMLHIN
jgi:hypothetical protein